MSVPLTYRLCDPDVNNNNNLTHISPHFGVQMEATEDIKAMKPYRNENDGSLKMYATLRSLPKLPKNELLTETP